MGSPCGFYCERLPGRLPVPVSVGAPPGAFSAPLRRPGEIAGGGRARTLGIRKQDMEIMDGGG